MEKVMEKIIKSNFKRRQRKKLNVDKKFENYNKEKIRLKKEINELIKRMGELKNIDFSKLENENEKNKESIEKH